MAPSQLAKAVALLTVTATSCSSVAVPSNMPLLYGSEQDGHNAYASALSRRGRRPNIAIPEELYGGFWFGTFTVGDSQNLSLLIDTGSKDIALNPGSYRPSIESQDLHNGGTMHYWSTEADGCGEANITFTVHSDRVSLGGELLVSGQTLALVVEDAVSKDSGVVTRYPRDGICGLGQTSEKDIVGGSSFMQTACNAGEISECRFGLALGTRGRGQQVLGGVNSSLFYGNLVEAPVHSQWQLPTSIIINGSKLMDLDTMMTLDSGASGIIGPPNEIRALFDAAGMEIEEKHLPGCASVLVGHYDCRNPPTIGFSFDGGENVFYVEPEALRLAENGDNTCTASISGIDSGAWVIGQSWFQGKYIDFNLDEGSVGVAELISKEGHSCSQFQCNFPNVIYNC